MALVCSILGTVILSIYLRWQGVMTLMISAVVLFIGAYLGNVLTANVDIPLDQFYVRPIFVSIVGMSVAALVLLLIFLKNQNE
ncbi:MAG: hypothetical protein IOC82_03595 [Aestuariivirga sp.]|nr:hypothetical protein [Aestuariivirga sp.]